MIGIIPAAGKAERMNGLPKMLLPTPPSDYGLIHLLRSSMKNAEPQRIMVGCNPFTYNLLEHIGFNPGGVFDVGFTATMSETVLKLGLLARYPATLFGMADTYFDDAAAFIKLAAALNDGADVAVGVFQTRPEQRHKLGMCRMDEYGRLIGVADKQAQTDLEWAWGVLAWKPAFWQFIDATHPHVGYALPPAIAAGLNVRAVNMDGGYYDCGTPDEYFDLITHLHGQKVTA